MRLLRDVVRTIVPAPVRQWGRGQVRAVQLRAAFRQLAALPQQSPCPDTILERLVRVWDNGGYSASAVLLSQVDRAILTTRQDILECGSGLSSLFLGLRTLGTGRRVLSLEHDPMWAAEVRTWLQRLHLSEVSVHCAPLRPYDTYDWYALDRATVDSYAFGLVVVDGPPGLTRGNRQGVVPQCRASFTDDVRVLLDDVGRAEEQAVLQRWQEEEGGVLMSVDPTGRVAIMGFPRVTGSC